MWPLPEFDTIFQIEGHSPWYRWWNNDVHSVQSGEYVFPVTDGKGIPLYIMFYLFLPKICNALDSTRLDRSQVPLQIWYKMSARVFDRSINIFDNVLLQLKSKSEAHSMCASLLLKPIIRNLRFLKRNSISAFTLGNILGFFLHTNLKGEFWSRQTSVVLINCWHFQPQLAKKISYQC